MMLGCREDNRWNIDPNQEKADTTLASSGSGKAAESRRGGRSGSSVAYEEISSSRARLAIPWNDRRAVSSMKGLSAMDG